MATGNHLINRVAYSYLEILSRLSATLRVDVSCTNAAINQAIQTIHTSCHAQTYDRNHAYLNDYRDILLALQLLVLHRHSLNAEQQQSVDHLVIAVYENDNLALVLTTGWLRQHQFLTHRLTDHTLKKAIRKQAQQKGGPNNFSNPVNNDSVLGALNAVMGSYFQPMLSGSIPTRRVYSYARTSHLTELRFGTQIEIIAGKIRINPLFKAYLTALNNRVAAQPDKITHIYFNSLRRGSGSIERKREGLFTEELMKLEAEQSNIAVITLPADGGLIDHEQIYHDQSSLTLESVIAEIKSVAINNGQDFYISPRIRQFTNLNVETINRLLIESIDAIGLSTKTHISPAERHALMFHFVKFSLTKYLIERLDPRVINFSCKDAIDRGGVHSLYYNLLRSLELGTPLSEQEFMQGIHAAPTYVKGRGMNHHSSMLWNVIDKYIRANTVNDNIPEWLVQWRNLNAPQKKLNIYNEPSAITKRVHYDFNNTSTLASKLFSILLLPLVRAFGTIISWFAVCKSLRHAPTDRPHLTPSTTDELTTRATRNLYQNISRRENKIGDIKRGINDGVLTPEMVFLSLFLNMNTTDIRSARLGRRFVINCNNPLNVRKIVNILRTEYNIVHGIQSSENLLFLDLTTVNRLLNCAARMPGPHGTGLFQFIHNLYAEHDKLEILNSNQLIRDLRLKSTQFFNGSNFQMAAQLIRNNDETAERLKKISSTHSANVEITTDAPEHQYQIKIIRDHFKISSYALKTSGDQITEVPNGFDQSRITLTGKLNRSNAKKLIMFSIIQLSTIHDFDQGWDINAYKYSLKCSSSNKNFVKLFIEEAMKLGAGVTLSGNAKTLYGSDPYINHLLVKANEKHQQCLSNKAPPTSLMQSVKSYLSSHLSKFGLLPTISVERRTTSEPQPIVPPVSPPTSATVSPYTILRARRASPMAHAVAFSDPTTRRRASM